MNNNLTDFLLAHVREVNKNKNLTCSISTRGSVFYVTVKQGNIEVLQSSAEINNVKQIKTLVGELQAFILVGAA